MPGRLIKQLTWAAVTLSSVAAAVPAAQAQDFFSQLFGGFGRSRGPMIRVPFGDGGPFTPQVERRHYGGGGQAYCVRTCDGRYFPLPGSDSQSREASCSNFCPASATKVVYGGNIDDAATENGTPYSELPNAFRYRNEIVAGCTCNGKDAVGLAPVKLEDDPTLRKGDIIASDHGLVVVGKSADKRGAALNFSPVPDRIRAKYQRVPVVASQ
jgi:Protein of unknown function (DUF2865)